MENFTSRTALRQIIINFYAQVMQALSSHDAPFWFMGARIIIMATNALIVIMGGSEQEHSLSDISLYHDTSCSSDTQIFLLFGRYRVPFTKTEKKNRMDTHTWTKGDRSGVWPSTVETTLSHKLKDTEITIKTNLIEIILVCSPDSVFLITIPYGICYIVMAQLLFFEPCLG